MLASFFGGIDDAVFAIQPKSVSEPEQVTMNAVGDGNIDGHSEPTSPHVSASKTGNVFSDALCSPLTSDGKPKPTSRRGSSFRYGGMRETPLATNSASFLSKSPTTASIPEALSISCDKERSPAEKALSCRAIHELATFDEGDDTHNAFDLRSSGLSSKGKDKDGLDVALRNTDLSGFASNPSSTKRPFENSLSLSCSDRRSSTSTHTTYASTCSGSGSGSSSESTINNNANIQGTYGSIDVPTSVTTIGTTSVSDACPAPTFPALFSDLFFHADLDACSSETETGIALGMVDGTDIAVADATENCHADAITALAPAAVSTATDLSITPSNPYMTDTNDISSPTTDAPVNGSALTPVVASADAPVVHAHIDAPVVASDSNADIPVNDHNNSSTPTINATINAIVSHGAVSPTSPGNNALSAKARAKKALDKWEKEREADKRRAIERIKEQKREASMRKLNVAASAATLFSVMVDAELHLAMAMDRWREILEREEVAKKTHRTGSIESILRLFSGIPSPKVLPNKQSFSDKNMQDPSSYLDLDADETPRMPSSDSIISLELKVLLFDKPSKDMKYLVNWLASMGCLVVIADTPKLALSCLKHESFDIAFIDLMPVSQKYQRELQRHRGSRQMIDRWMNWQMPLPEHIAAMANTDDETMPVLVGVEVISNFISWVDPTRSQNPSRSTSVSVRSFQSTKALPAHSVAQKSPRSPASSRRVVTDSAVKPSDSDASVSGGAGSGSVDASGITAPPVDAPTVNVDAAGVSSTDEVNNAAPGTVTTASTSAPSAATSLDIGCATADANANAATTSTIGTGISSDSNSDRSTLTADSSTVVKPAHHLSISTSLSTSALPTTHSTSSERLQMSMSFNAGTASTANHHTALAVDTAVIAGAPGTAVDGVVGAFAGDGMMSARDRDEELYRRMEDEYRAINKDIMIVGMGTHMSELEQAVAYNSGMHFFCPKPLQVDMLSALLMLKGEQLYPSMFMSPAHKSASSKLAGGGSVKATSYRSAAGGGGGGGAQENKSATGTVSVPAPMSTVMSCAKDESSTSVSASVSTASSIGTHTTHTTKQEPSSEFSTPGSTPPRKNRTNGQEDSQSQSSTAPNSPMKKPTATTTAAGKIAASLSGALRSIASTLTGSSAASGTDSGSSSMTNSPVKGRGSNTLRIDCDNITKPGNGSTSSFSPAAPSRRIACIDRDSHTDKDKDSNKCASSVSSGGFDQLSACSPLDPMEHLGSLESHGTVGSVGVTSPGSVMAVLSIDKIEAKERAAAKVYASVSASRAKPHQVHVA